MRSRNHSLWHVSSTLRDRTSPPTRGRSPGGIGLQCAARPDQSRLACVFSPLRDCTRPRHCCSGTLAIGQGKIVDHFGVCTEAAPSASHSAAPPSPCTIGVSVVTERGRRQNDSTLARRACHSAAPPSSHASPCSVGVSIMMERGRQQNHRTLAGGYRSPRRSSAGRGRTTGTQRRTRRLW